jgi:hypothetical protein
LNAQLGPAGTFWLYAVICMFGFIFIWKKLPETKGRTLEEIEGDLPHKPSQSSTELIQAPCVKAQQTPFRMQTNSLEAGQKSKAAVVLRTHK